MPETADRIESLFAAALALPPGEREAYLERECCRSPYVGFVFSRWDSLDF